MAHLRDSFGSSIACNTELKKQISHNITYINCFKEVIPQRESSLIIAKAS
ncbi:hypothetical protein GCM10007916_16490 [Psychromonas marina]|uniref:Uncharacterized protein n=1 Tax=Psychromonas marina TaxID=88364 RepID=A0ABQ6DZS6_9GAMM|nr:hypothetical protein GCM10007916_16490 [Psychromonas marina]